MIDKPEDLLKDPYVFEFTGLQNFQSIKKAIWKMH